MNSYFEVAIRYDKMQENGVVKTVTESYLVEAMTFADAEIRITNEMRPYMSGDFRVVKEKITNISEVITTLGDECDKFYKVKHNIITIDKRTAKEKKQPQYLLFQAASNDDARDRYNAFMHGSINDTELESIAETKLMDYIPYSAK